MFSYSYLGPEVLRGFESYRYSCQDTSPLSNYVMHPFWNQVVKLCPSFVAPNLLTFVGFLCCVVHFLIPTVLDYDFSASVLGSSSTPIPSGAWFAVSLFLFLSHTLDGIDGKQARRTGTSSPLGELFDHGCDSWSTVFIASTFYHMFGRNDDDYSVPVFRMYLIIWAVFFTFHICHWEKYNTGIMYLPWSYDVAMLGGAILYFLTGCLGYETWKVKLPGGLHVGPLLEYILYFGCYGLSFFMALNNIVTAYKAGTHKHSSLSESLRPMASYLLAYLVCVAWAGWSPSSLLERDPICFFYMSGTLYANMSCRLIVAQMSSTRSELVNHLLWPLSACALLALSGLVSSAVELGLLYSLTAIVTAAHLHYVINVVGQMCQLLNIQCFKIAVSSSDEKGTHRLIPTTDDYESDSE